MPWEVDSDFVARFKATILRVYNLDKSVNKLPLKHRLHATHLTYSLDKNPIKSYSKMLARMQKYFYKKEGAISRCEVDRRSKKKAREEPTGAPTNNPNLSDQWRPKLRNSASRSDNYTPLSPQSKILMKIEGEQYLWRPVPPKPSTSRNKKNITDPIRIMTTTWMNATS